MSLQAELEHARQERDRWAIIVAYLEERTQTPAAANGGKPARRKGRPTAAAAAAEVLRAAGEPMRTPDLLKAVQALGAQIADTDGLYKTLSRHDTFKRAGRGLWTLA